jgi:spore coat protein U-like protein
MRLRNLLFCLATLLAGSPAWSALACTIIASPSQLKYVYQSTANLNVTGTLSVTCTRAAGDPGKHNIWIGMSQPVAGGTATLDTGGSTLTYTVAHGGYASGIWTNTGAVAPTSTNTGAITEQIDFGRGGRTITLTRTYTFYFRVAQSQSKPVGVYVATLPITLRLNNATGTILSTTPLDIVLSIPNSCRFSTPPTPIEVNYPAFSTSAVPGQSNFALTCTQGTIYTIALDAARSVIPNVELSYGLTLSAASSTGTAVSQGYQVDVSIDAGQAGKCNGSVCTGTDTRTITITY